MGKKGGCNTVPFHVSLLQSYMAIVDDKLMIAFLFAVILDIGTGMAKGIINQRTGKLNSTKGLFGLIKHSTVIFLILLIFSIHECNRVSTNS